MACVHDVTHSLSVNFISSSTSLYTYNYILVPRLPDLNDLNVHALAGKVLGNEAIVCVCTSAMSSSHLVRLLKLS